MRFPVCGTIVSDEDAAVLRYFGLEALCPAVCPQDLRQAIRDTPAGETLTLEINSPGGALFAGFEMYTVLAGASVPVTVEVQSLAGSAASVLLPAAGRVVCSPVGQVMIHLPATETSGNEGAHRESIAMLRAATESILNAYCAKCGSRVSRDALREMMRRETFLTARQALDIGLVDEVLGESPSDPRAVFNCLSGGRTAGTLPDLAALRAAYAAAKLGNARPPSDAADRDRLALELARFV